MAFALVAASSARSPEAGTALRLAFVAAALGGSALLWWVHGWWRPSGRALLLWAVALRLIFAPLLPGLSDDGYRYLWDGLLQAQGISPYAYVPSDPALARFQDSVLYERMNSPDYHSVYPPVSQVGFRIAALALPLGWEWAWYLWKALVLAAEAVGAWALFRLVGARRSMLYALNPVVLIEVAGQAHTEGLLLGALGGIVLSLSGSARWAGLGVAAATFVKLWPVAWALFVCRSSRRGLAGLTLIGALGLFYEVHRYAPNILESLRLYAGTFDFYSLPYLVLKAAMYGTVGEMAGALAASGMTLAWGGVCVYAWMRSPRTGRSLMRAVSIVTVGYVLASPTLHPWHLLAALFVLPLLENKTWLSWLAAMSVSGYLVYMLPGVGLPITLIGWVGAATLFTWERRSSLLAATMRWRARGKTREMAEVLRRVPPGRSVLDLGAGEGYVGRDVGDRLGVAVEAIDVANLGDRFGPRVDLYDGLRIPRPDGAYDATLIVYVLHHARVPVRLLHEAVRVTRGPVIVLETVCHGPRSKRWLEAVDRLVNRIRSRGRIDEEPLTIRTDAEWVRRFEAEGFRLRHRETRPGLHPKALYVLDGGHVAASMTRSGVRPSASSTTASG
ncbi:MAG: class I SAM-dependent methyltransferase [Bacteroidota bacterium]